MVSQVGWIKFDGDEHHDFRYWSPEDRRRLSRISAEGFLPVYVPDTLDDDLAIIAMIDEPTVWVAACDCPCHQVIQPGLVPCPRCEQESGKS